MRVYTRDARRATRLLWNVKCVKPLQYSMAIEYRIVSMSNVRANRDFPPRPPTYVRIPSQSDLRRLVDWRTASDRTTGVRERARSSHTRGTLPFTLYRSRYWLLRCTVVLRSYTHTPPRAPRHATGGGAYDAQRTVQHTP